MGFSDIKAARASIGTRGALHWDLGVMNHSGVTVSDRRVSTCGAQQSAWSAFDLGTHEDIHM